MLALFVASGFLILLLPESGAGLAEQQQPAQVTHMLQLAHLKEVVLTKDNGSFGIGLAGGHQNPKQPYIHVSRPG